MTNSEKGIVGVYAALNVPLTNQLVSVQKDICKEFGLIPRPEFHVTFGFLGEVSERRIKELGEVLSSHVPNDLHTINLLGVGGAFDDEGKIRLINQESKELVQNKPRVFWLQVERTDSIYQLRMTLAEKAREIGLDASKVTSNYFPHITLGSAGPTASDYTLWDVHTVPKTNTYMRGLIVDSVSCDIAHITSVGSQPQSLYVLRSWI